MTGPRSIAVTVLAAAIVLGSCSSKGGFGNSGITGATTCKEYLGFPDQERAAAVRTLGVEAGWKQAGNPMSVLNVDSHCGQRPTQTMTQALGLFAKGS